MSLLLENHRNRQFSRAQSNDILPLPSQYISNVG